MSTAPVYMASPTKTARRTKAEIEHIEQYLYDFVRDHRPVTVRQVFYRAVTAGIINKTETEYNATVIRLLTELRTLGLMPYSWIADNTRWQRKPNTHGSIIEAIHETARFYRQAIWRDLDVCVEVWLEKEALAGVLYDVTYEYDVALMVTRGYASLSYLHSAAEAISAQGKPAFIYYFGDHDPSGQDISANVERRLREFAPDAEIHFERIAVTPGQIFAWNLPTRPTKKTDSRARKFQGESTEVDAIDPDTLRDLTREAIELHIPGGWLDSVRAAEESEREIGLRIAGGGVHL
jgi:hypothetical protein